MLKAEAIVELLVAQTLVQVVVFILTMVEDGSESEGNIERFEAVGE